MIEDEDDDEDEKDSIRMADDLLETGAEHMRHPASR